MEKRASILLYVAINAVFLLSGCVAKEKVVTHDVMRSGDNWVQRETVQKQQGPRGKYVVERQNMYEKTKCVDRKGRTIKATTPEACIKAGGRVVDEMIVEEESTTNR